MNAYAVSAWLIFLAPAISWGHVARAMAMEFFGEGMVGVNEYTYRQLIRMQNMMNKSIYIV